MKCCINQICQFGKKVSFLLLIALYLLSSQAYALRMTNMPQSIQTKTQEPRMRTISLKLPLLQPKFHWSFLSQSDLLSGKLTLRIIRNEEPAEIVIFENGQFTDGWEAMPFSNGPNRGEIYFGFISKNKYATAPSDSLELELTVRKDLAGIGPRQTGTLAAGTYKTRGTYSGLIDDYDVSRIRKELAKEGKFSASKQEDLLKKMREMYENKAFLQSWTDQWSLEITSNKGWLTKTQALSFSGGQPATAFPYESSAHSNSPIGSGFKLDFKNVTEPQVLKSELFLKFIEIHQHHIKQQPTLYYGEDISKITFYYALFTMDCSPSTNTKKWILKKMDIHLKDGSVKSEKQPVKVAFGMTSIISGDGQNPISIEQHFEPK